ncbi:MAG: hypothetical protein SCH66_13070 [Methanolobus sp.]|nr:hypothetical protein [Methanolobus sp.]
MSESVTPRIAIVLHHPHPASSNYKSHPFHSATPYPCIASQTRGKSLTLRHCEKMTDNGPAY